MSRSCAPLLDVPHPHSTCTPTPTSLLSTSHGDDQCDDLRSGATFGRLAESNTLTSYEPNDLVEMNNTEVTPIFFQRPSVTSTHDSAEGILELGVRESFKSLEVFQSSTSFNPGDAPPNPHNYTNKNNYNYDNGYIYHYKCNHNQNKITLSGLCVFGSCG